MHGIFWKFFWAFWLSLLLFISATLWLTSWYLEQTRGLDDESHPRPQWHDYVQQARRVARNSGLAGLQQWMQQLDRNEVVPYFLIDSRGLDQLQRDVPASVAERLQRRLHRPGGGGGRGLRHRQGLIVMPDGQALHLLPYYQGVTLYRLLARPRVVAIPLITGLIISALAGFVLARYLTRPIQQLRTAASRFAAGELGTRIAPKLVQRRDEIGTLGKEFDRMAERIQQLLDSHMQLVADVSHELRSPLARLQVAVGLARQKAPKPINNELDRIEYEAEQLNAMIGQVITISRLQSGSRELQMQLVNINELLQQVVDQARYEGQQRQCAINLSACAEISIRADAGLLQSAFENVVRNAIRYTAEGSSIDIAVESNYSKQALISVRDHGPGVPDDRLEKLFEPFVRIDPSRDRGSGGFGLGLAIAQRAVLLHKGQISAHNHDHGGLQVSIQLPLAEPARLQSDP